MAFVDVRIEGLNNIVQQLGSDIMAPHTGALPVGEVIYRVEDLK